MHKPLLLSIGLLLGSAPSLALAQGDTASQIAVPVAEEGGVYRLSLSQAFGLAVERSPSLDIAELTQVQARILETRARLNRYTLRMDVNSGYNLGYVKVPGEDGVGSQTLNYGATVSGGVPLYAGGAVNASIEQAEIDRRIADIDYVTSARAIERAVYLAYWNIKSFELQILANQEALNNYEEALVITNGRADAGLLAPIDVNRSEVQVLDQQNALLQLDGQRYQAVQDLLRLMNLSGEDVILVEEASGLAKVWPEAAAPLLEEAHSKRPELIRIREEIARARAQVVITRSGALPVVSLGGSLGVQAQGTAGAEQQFIDPFTGQVFILDEGDLKAEELKPTFGASAGLSVSWTPFNLMRVRDAVQVAEYSVTQAEARYANQALSVDQEVKSNLKSFQILEARSPIIEKRKDLAEDNLKIIQALYAQGSSTILDLFNAQTSYQGASVQRASQEVSLIVAEYELRWSLGERFATE